MLLRSEILIKLLNVDTSNITKNYETILVLYYIKNNYIIVFKLYDCIMKKY